MPMRSRIDFRTAYPSDATVVVRHGTSKAENGLNLITAYNNAKTLTPGGLALSATNRSCVVVPPGEYELPVGGWTLDTNFVDLIGGSGEVKFDGTNIHSSVPTIDAVTGITISGITDINISKLHFTSSIAAAYLWTISNSSFVNSCISDVRWSGDALLTVLVKNSAGVLGGIWTNCHTNKVCFLRASDYNTTIAGKHIDCSAGNQSFGNVASALTITYSGIAIRCTTGTNSFACCETTGGAATFSGKLFDCKYGQYSVATGPTSAATVNVTFSGEMYNCNNSAINRSVCFTRVGTANFSGTVNNCAVGSYCICNSWNGAVTFSANVFNTTCGDYCLGYTTTSGNLTLAGRIVNVTAGRNSIGYASGTVSLANLYVGSTTVGNYSLGSGNNENIDVASTCVFENVSAGTGGLASTWGVGKTATFAGTAINVRATDGFAVTYSTGTATFSGSAYNCKTTGDYSFGSSSSSGAAVFSGIAENCTASNSAFGSSLSGSVTFSGRADRCRAGVSSFGKRGTVSATARLNYCVTGKDSFGNTTAANAAVFNNCIMSGISVVAEAPIFNGAILKDCIFVTTGGNANAIRVQESGTVSLYRCDLLANGSGYSVATTTGTANIKMSYCNSNLDIDPNITNLIGTSYNVVDSDYSITV